LFRGSSREEKAGDTPVSVERIAFDDVTQSTNLADLDELRGAVDAARRAAGIVGGEEFTEIRRVIRRPDGTARLEDSLGPDSTIPDLPFRTHLDSTTPRITPMQPKVDVEAEDDALVFVTRREGAGPAELELDPVTEAEPHPDAQRFLAEAEEIARREAAEAEQSRRRAERDRRSRSQPSAPRRTRRGARLPIGWLVAAALLAVVAGTLLVVVIALYGLG
jgi:hypothetical protein